MDSDMDMIRQASKQGGKGGETERNRGQGIGYARIGKREGKKERGSVLSTTSGHETR